ncbi:23S rRNA (cytosine1962-C5)-methyltransferase [Trypanosoma grayi]|uniref:23S rRNA (cytosine1962-C5)-methyltransferase n=1 Tax=Trypanosoma grayi TaxID=71804 RepID=UPI0004F3F58A|nr:23S rRNA (cytosine1962-C5)-methyltransferase [Trypanosoma grayi]KEG15614.1 23S rRNA (cytosine1962-C5)-methyltransferase [Trypanosoma grayi]
MKWTGKRNDGGGGVAEAAMWSKVFSPLLANRLRPAQTFPQLKFRPQQHRPLTNQRRCAVPLSLLDPNSLDFARREIAPGDVVELRDSEHHRLLALGFYEPALLRVDVFHVTPKVVSELPIISEEFFLRRVREAWERRRRAFGQAGREGNNAYRVVNGTVDGVPSLYVDLFSSSFARVVATSTGAERLVPCVTEMLRRQGAEEVLLDTPYLKDREKLTLVHPTISLPGEYVENGTSHLWVPSTEYPATRSNRWLVNTAHRRTRRLLRDVCRGKRVLCLNDRSGAAALNAVMSAKQVVVSETDTALLDRVRENLVANHATAVFKTCETVAASLEDLDLRKQDVVCLEHHPYTLSSAGQWQTAFMSLLQRRICGDGSVLFVAQETAPLGITDLLQQQSSDARVMPALRDEISQAIRAAAGKHKLSTRQIRVFGPSIDHPVLPLDDSPCFSQVFLLEGSS